MDFPNSREHYYSDGSVKIEYTNGTVAYINSDQTSEVFYSDGSREMYDVQGNIVC